MSQLRRLYLWQAIDSQGQLRQGELFAAHKQEALQQVIQLGLQPYQLSRGAIIRARYWRGDTLIVLTRQLATLLQAGLPLLNSLRLLAQEHPAPAWRCMLQIISQHVARGEPFSEAIAHQPGVFPSIFHQLIAIGELTGKLETCCLQLAQQQEQHQQLQKKIIKSMRYPMFICAVSLLVSILMLTLVLPEFANIYQSFNAPLPWFTQALLSLSNILTRHGLYLLAPLVCIISYYHLRLHPQPQWQQREQKIIMAIPIIAPLLREGYLSQIFQTLAMTQQAGLPLPEGLNAAALAINNVTYQHAVRDIQQEVMRGIPLYQALQQHRLFPALCQQMVRVGEESGALDALLAKLAEWYGQQTHERAERLTQALEPLLMLVIGSIVGGLVIAMYLPIFQLGNVMS